MSRFISLSKMCAACASAVWAASFAAPRVVQAAGDVALLLAQAEQKNNVVTSSSRSYVLESIVVVLLFGAALFAVCKSSNRV